LRVSLYCHFFHLVGLGSGSVWGNVILWLEDYFRVTNKVASLLTVSASVGVNLAPLLVGQWVSIFPMSLIYLQVCVTAFMTVVYFSVLRIGRGKARENERRRLEAKSMKKRSRKEAAAAVSQDEAESPLKAVD